MMSCSDSPIEQNGARPPYWRIVSRRSRRPVSTLCGYAWWPTSQRILSRGESSRLWSATASSQVPRLAPKCPPISPITSMTSSRTSWAICCSSASLVAAMRLAELVVASNDVEDVVDDLEQHAQLVGEAAVGNCLRFLEGLQCQHDADAGGNQTPGLQTMEAPQLFRAQPALRDV